MTATRHKKKKPHSGEKYPKQPTLFHHQEQSCEHGTTQTTNVTVNIEEAGEDCMAGCFKMLAGLGKKAAE